METYEIFLLTVLSAINLAIASIVFTPVMGTPSQAILHTLSYADGSVTYTAANESYQIIAGVNYPVEVPFRSDEIPESTFIEVNIRPHNGVGMVQERHIEDLVKRTLQTVVLGEETPRTMLQVTLQVVSVATDERLPGGVKSGGQGEPYLDILASSLNAAILACLDAGVQMQTMAGAAVIGHSRSEGRVVVNPGVLQRKQCSSLHVFAFTKNGKTVLMESEGKFSLADFKQAEQTARLAVLGHLANSTNASKTHKQPSGDVAMNGTGDSPVPTVLEVMRKAMEARVIKDERRRQD